MEEEMEKEVEELKGCKNYNMLGVLAVNENFYPAVGQEKDVVSQMKGGASIVFYIKSVSGEPLPIRKYLNKYLDEEEISKLYIGIDSDQNNTIIPIDFRYKQNSNEKIKFIKDTLKDKLLLIKPIIKLNNNSKKGVNDKRPFKNVEVISIKDEISLDDKCTFIAIPKTKMASESFEDKLLNGDTFEINEDYKNYFDNPKYIVCENYLYYNLTGINRCNESDTSWECVNHYDSIKKIKLSLEKNLKDNYSVDLDNLVFYKKDYFRTKIESQMDVGGEYIKKEQELNIIDENSYENPEYNFLLALKNYTIDNNLSYRFEDLVNFHISVKTNPLTIIAGMSGTGKTQLALAYSKMLSLDSPDTLLILPINPSYTEPGDVLGYLNNTNGLYIPSDTGLIELLVHAQNNKDKMHMVIFDEMNLSQAEYWFAPFISLLELDSKNRKLKLYSRGSICHNHIEYPSDIEIGNNIIFVGTINVDETTKDFSDRLLDRANVIFLKKNTFMEFYKEQEENGGDSHSDYKKLKCNSACEYHSWMSKKDPRLAYSEEEIKFFDDLHSIIQKYDYQKGISFRIFKKIGNYLNNIPKDEKGDYLIARKDAIDIQVKQRFLTKVKGTSEQFQNLVGIFNKENNQEKPVLNSELWQFFNKEQNKKISDFELTKGEIVRKSKELSVYGYTG